MIPRPIRRLAVVATLALAAGCNATPGAAPSQAAPSEAAATQRPCPTAQPDALAAGETRTVTIATDLGEIAIGIEADLSPIAAGNFVALAECGFYEDVVFHRVVQAFVIQGGDGENGRSPAVNAAVGTGGPGYTIKDEPVTATYGRGTVAMARTAEPDSVGSQFFIVLDDGARGALEAANTYQIIGTVTSGMETADAIAEAAGREEIPSQPVVMIDVNVTTP